MRLLDEPFFLQPSEDAADSRGRDAEPAAGDEHRRRDRLARRDVFTHKRSQHALLSVLGFQTHVVFLAVSPGDC